MPLILQFLSFESEQSWNRAVFYALTEAKAGVTNKVVTSQANSFKTEVYQE